MMFLSFESMMNKKLLYWGQPKFSNLSPQFLSVIIKGHLSEKDKILP